MKKVFKVAICLALICLFSGINYANAQKNENYFTIDYYACDLNVSGMPESFRNVPMHKNDGNALSGAILQESYKLLSYVKLGYRKIFVSEKFIKLGYDLTALLPYSNVREKVYITNPGSRPVQYGDYSVFCQTTVGGPISSITGIKSFMCDLSIIPGFIMETNLSKSTKLNPRIFLNTSYQTLMAINGWRKNNFKTINEQKVLAHVIPLNLGLGIDILNGDATINTGLSANLFLKTKAGEEFKASSTPFHFFVNLNLKITNY